MNTGATNRRKPIEPLTHKELRERSIKRRAAEVNKIENYTPLHTFFGKYAAFKESTRQLNEYIKQFSDALVRSPLVNDADGHPLSQITFGITDPEFKTHLRKVGFEVIHEDVKEGTITWGWAGEFPLIEFNGGANDQIVPYVVNPNNKHHFGMGNVIDAKNISVQFDFNTLSSYSVANFMYLRECIDSDISAETKEGVMRVITEDLQRGCTILRGVKYNDVVSKWLVLSGFSITDLGGNILVGWSN